MHAAVHHVQVHRKPLWRGSFTDGAISLPGALARPACNIPITPDACCSRRDSPLVCALLQRMCDDVPAFADASVTLVIGITKKFFMMVGFSGDTGCGFCPASQACAA